MYRVVPISDKETIELSSLIDRVNALRDELLSELGRLHVPQHEIELVYSILMSLNYALCNEVVRRLDENTPHASGGFPLSDFQEEMGG